MLATIPAPVNTLGHNRVNPSVNFMPIDQPTSSRPATRSRTQAMTGTSGTRAERGCVVFASCYPVRRVSSGVLLHRSKGRAKGPVTRVTGPRPSPTAYALELQVQPGGVLGPLQPLRGHGVQVPLAHQ